MDEEQQRLLRERELELEAQAELELEAQQQQAPVSSPYASSAERFGNELFSGQGALSDFTDTASGLYDLGSRSLSHASDALMANPLNPAGALLEGGVKAFYEGDTPTQAIYKTGKTAAGTAAMLLTPFGMGAGAGGALFDQALVGSGKLFGKDVSGAFPGEQLPTPESYARDVRSGVVLGAPFAIGQGAARGAAATAESARLLKHRTIGKSPAYEAYEAIVKDPAAYAAETGEQALNASVVGEQAAKGMQQVISRTPTGRLGGRELADGYTALANDAEASALITDLPKRAASFQELLETPEEAARLTKLDSLANKVIKGRDLALEQAEAVNNTLNAQKQPGELATGIISGKDLGPLIKELDDLEGMSLARGPDNPGPLKEEVQRAREVLFDLEGTQGGILYFGENGAPIVDGLTITQAQKKISQLNTELRREGLYNKNPQAAIAEGRVPRTQGEVQTLSRIKNGLQDVLRAKLAETGDPQYLAAYDRGNKIYGAIKDIQPLNQIFSTEAGAAGQRVPATSFVGAMRNVGSAALEVGKRLVGVDNTGVGLRKSALRQMQLALNTFAYREPQSLLSRSVERLSNNKANLATVGALAAEAGLIADPKELEGMAPYNQEAIIKQVAAMNPQAFEPSKSGLPSEFDGKIEDPFEGDYYLKWRYGQLADDPSSRADILGPFLSQRKVVDPGTVGGVKQTELPEFNALELYPQLDGGFGLESTLDMGAKKQQAENVSIAEMLKSIQESYQ